MTTAQPSIISPFTRPETAINVLTNQLYIEFPDNWSSLLQGYSLWRYRLSETQNNHRRYADKNFYGRFTNAYKNNFDRPFYYFTFDEPQAALYSLLPHGHHPEPWLYPFGNSVQTKAEEIVGEIVAPDEVRPHVVLKLMVALCFYETSLNEGERRVCQSKFYLRVKGKAGDNFLTAIEVQPSVIDVGYGHLMTLNVEANWFAKVRSSEDKAYFATGAYYELFDSRGQTYLRQIRPDLVADFPGDLYQQKIIKGKKAKADWHNDGAKYKESRSYLVRHVQERLMSFMSHYGFRTSVAQETMYRQPTQDVPLPLQRFTSVQVLDNRLNKTIVSTATYLNWLRSYHFPTSDGLITLPFELVDLSSLNNEKPLLVLNDVEASAFGYDDNGKPHLLTAQGMEDPYQVLYNQLPNTVKQSLNVNPNHAVDFTVVQDYLNYHLAESQLRPGTIAYRASDKSLQAESKALTNLTRNLEVCLSELWLKWVISGKAKCSPSSSCLPYFAQLSDAWGFVTDNILLYIDQGIPCFADLMTPDGKRFLKERFTAWSDIKKQFMARTLKDDKKADIALPNAHFVLIGNVVVEIECTLTMAMPNWPVVKAIKADDASKSARSREAIGVYAGGIWYNEETQRYIVSGTESSAGKEERGHHIYQIHTYGEVDRTHLSTLLSLLTVTFVRKNRFTVWPYPFDLIRLRRELIQ